MVGYNLFRNLVLFGSDQGIVSQISIRRAVARAFDHCCSSADRPLPAPIALDEPARRLPIMCSKILTGGSMLSLTVVRPNSVLSLPSSPPLKAELSAIAPASLLRNRWNRLLAPSRCFCRHQTTHTSPSAAIARGGAEALRAACAADIG